MDEGNGLKIVSAINIKKKWKTHNLPGLLIPLKTKHVKEEKYEYQTK